MCSSDLKIVEGNRKVLAARLSDARFFYETDLKVPLEEQAKKLEKIVFHEKLGKVVDKVERVAKLARWLVDHERARRGEAMPIATEARGKLVISGPAGPFVLTAKADRVDRLASGGLAIVDYKTGRLPTAKEIDAGYAPQLPLEAAIALGKDGFAGVAGANVESLEYWRLSGGNPAGEVYAIQEKRDRSVAELAREARDGLERLVARFDAEATPYHARPRPQFAPRYSDYEHLARVREWADEPDDDRP